MAHALIVGPRHVGKTTLINRILRELKRPVYGYQTKKESSLLDGQMRAPVYIYEPGKPRLRSSDNLLGYCGASGGFSVIEGAFDRHAADILRPVPKSGVIVFDEIGFMESREQRFCRAVLERLRGDIPVIAAVKDKTGVEFLEKVRSHPKCRCFYITEQNREGLFPEVLDFMKAQLMI